MLSTPPSPPPPPSVRPTKPGTKSAAARGLAYTPASQDAAPAADKDAVSLKTLSLGLQVVLLAAQAFG